MKDFPLFRSPRAAAIGVVLMALPTVGLSLLPLGGLYATLAVLFLLPAAMCISGLVCGAAPMMAGAAFGLVSMYWVGGSRGLTLGAVYLLPILAAFVLIVALRIPFKQGCPAMIGVHLLAMAGCFLMLQQWAGGRLYAAAGNAVMNVLDRWELGDTMLYQLYAMGMIDLPDALSGTAIQRVIGGYALSEAARSDLLLSVRSLVSGALAAMVPNVIVSQSILGGVACLLLPLRFGYIAAEKRAFLEAPVAEEGEEPRRAPVDFPDLQMPKFESWHLPRGIGWQVGLALVIGYFLSTRSGTPAGIAGTILYSASRAVFSIQGAALVNYMQKTRGTKRVWRVIVPLLLMLFSVLIFLGIFDQISNVRGLRKPREPKEGFWS